jgi:hypothetical protein
MKKESRVRQSEVEPIIIQMQKLSRQLDLGIWISRAWETQFRDSSVSR